MAQKRNKRIKFKPFTVTLGNGETVSVQSQAEASKLARFIHENPSLYSAPGQGAPEQQGVLGPLERFGQAAWQNAKGMAGGLGAAANPTVPLVTGPNSLLERLYLGPAHQAKELGQQTRAAGGLGNQALGYAEEAAGGIPGIGPWLDSIAKQVQQGNYAGATGNALSGAVLGRMMEAAPDYLRASLSPDSFTYDAYLPDQQAIGWRLANRGNALAKFTLDALDKGHEAVGRAVKGIENADIQAETDPQNPNPASISGLNARDAGLNAVDQNHQAGSMTNLVNTTMKPWLQKPNIDDMSWTEAKEMRTAVSRAAARAAIPADQVYLNGVKDSLTKDLINRAKELGKKSEWDDYHKKFVALTKAENKAWGALTSSWEEGDAEPFQKALNRGLSLVDSLTNLKEAGVDVDTAKMGKLVGRYNDAVNKYGKYLDLQKVKQPQGSLGAILRRPIVAGITGLPGMAIARTLPGAANSWLSQMALVGHSIHLGTALLDKMSLLGEQPEVFGRPYIPPDTTPEEYQNYLTDRAEKLRGAKAGAPPITPPMTSTGVPQGFQWPQQLYGGTAEGGVAGGPELGPGEPPTPQGPGTPPAPMGGLPSGQEVGNLADWLEHQTATGGQGWAEGMTPDQIAKLLKKAKGKK